MSLLLDALRRAEEARRAKEADTSAVKVASAPPADKPVRAKPITAALARELAIDDAVSLAPGKLVAGETSRTTPTATARSELALEAMGAPALAADFALAPVSRAQRSHKTPENTIPKESTQREAARNVFAAKQPNLQSVSGSGKRKWILPVIGGVFVLLGAGGWYVWNEINRVSQPMVARAPSQPAVLARAAPGTGQVGTKSPVTVDTSAAKVAEVPVPSLLPPPAADTPAPKIPVSLKAGTERVFTQRETLASNLRDAPIPKEAPMGLKLARSIEPAKINPDLATAYQSLLSGDYVVAQKLYARLALTEPLNVDAQLGLATAAARSGDIASATQHYRQVLALDPRNGLAIMGLVAIKDGAQPAALEVELKTLIGRNPEAAPLHFALGNIYAGDRRWTEAQQAYFEAFRIDSMNPDYLFNLAVSLDQLRQSKLALDYYRKAEAQSVTRGGGQFDRSVVAKRIKELSGETGRSN
jgi:Tfp pilus assembly protein PilF